MADGLVSLIDNRTGVALDFLVKWTLGDPSLFVPAKSVLDLTGKAKGMLFNAGVGRRQDLEVYSQGTETIYLLGDMVTEPNEKRDFAALKRLILSNSVHCRGGVFYLIYHSLDGKLLIYSSLFSILPLYFMEQKEMVLVSSRTDLIREACGNSFSVDKSYLLERLIFNYGMFNRSYWKGIRLVPSNSFLSLDETININPTLDWDNLYVESPSRGRSVLNRIAGCFIEETKKYLPSEKYAISFTGGFDGRTLLAASLHFRKDFCAYSFGSSSSSDLTMPMEQANRLNIEFLPVFLEGDYVSQHSYQDALALIDLTEGYASFSRAHYLYAARTLGIDYHFMITGNFGSELFRAAHVAGVMMSGELYKVIACRDLNDIAGIIRTSPKLRYLRSAEFEPEIQMLAEELVELRKSNAHLSANALLYKFTFTEIFRKYFGPEIVMQRNFINNRAPYLDFDFIKFLTSTYYCGAYSDFNTHNPAKRFKGQLAYAHIIKNAFPPLFKMKTNKGYRPSDLVSIHGKLNLVRNLLAKKFRTGTNLELDPFSVNRAFAYNHRHYRQWPINDDLYVSGAIREGLSRPATIPGRDVLFNVISTNYYLHKAQSE